MLPLSCKAPVYSLWSLTLCHSPQVGRKTKLLNQRLGRMPDFQTQAVKGPLCPLQSFTGTADSRSEKAFQACLYQSNLLLCSGETPGETSAPWLCWREGAWLCAPPASQTPGCQTFPWHRPALKQHHPTSACGTCDSWKSFLYREKQDTCQEEKLSLFQFYYIPSTL